MELAIGLLIFAAFLLLHGAGLNLIDACLSHIEKKRPALIFFTSFLALVPSSVHAEDTEKTPLNQLLGTGDELSLGGFVDTDLSFDFNEFKPRNRAYLTQPTRDREGQINLAFVEAKLNTDQFRGRIAVQGGSSVDVNYATEPDRGWRYIQEAFLGTKLTDGLWLDGGIYFSHIGPENWVSRENWAYTKLLTSEFTPYYEEGVKLTYDPTDAMEFQLHWLNGWQNISDFSGRNALGMVGSYKFTNGWSLQYDNFLGNEHAGARFFNEIIVKPAPIGPVELAACVNAGNQNGVDGAQQWYSWSLLGRYSVSDSIKLIARAEQYLDPKNVIVSTPTGDPFKTLGFSAGVDVEVLKRLWWRTEYRAFVSPDAIFQANEDDFKTTDHFVVTSLSYAF